MRDTVFSDEVFPALYYPPWSSYEALVGAVARASGILVPDIAYLIVPPIASALAVFALWRLLRSWRVLRVGLALSVAIVFLLFDADGHRTLGTFFVTRIWQGKAIFVAVLVPVLFSLLQDYAERRTPRRLALVFAGGVAAVGLTTTAIFVVPVIAAGYLLSGSLRSRTGLWRAACAVAAYPVAVGLISLYTGARNPFPQDPSRIVAQQLTEEALGRGVPAGIAVAALLLGPMLLRRRLAGTTVAATVLVVGVLFFPGAPQLLYDATGLGTVLWRLMWAIPVAALVGVIATIPTSNARLAAVGTFSALICGALVIWGTPVWSSEAGATVMNQPAWKRPPDSIATARRILAASRPGDTILAPFAVSQTILVMSGTVTTVNPRDFFLHGLRDVPGGHAHERLLLQQFAAPRHTPSRRAIRAKVRPETISAALRTVGVDLACVPRHRHGKRRTLLQAGYSATLETQTLTCLRARSSSAAAEKAPGF